MPASPAAHAQDAPNRFPVYQDGAWGYIDSTGSVVIEPQFDEVQSFSDGWARVKEGDAFKFIDASGKVVLEPKAVYVGPFSEGRAVVRPQEEDLLGYIDKKGNVVIEPRFQEAYQFSEGRAAVYTGNPKRAEPKYGYIDPEGAFVIEPQFWGARRYAGGQAPVLVGGFVDGQWGYIDPDGAMVIEPQFEQAQPFSEGRAAVSVGDDFDAKWGYIDEEGQQVIEPKYELARTFSGGRGLVEDMFDDWQYIDRSGEQVFEKKYAYAEPFAGPLARVAVEAGGGGHGSQGGTLQFFPGVSDGDWRYIDRQGRRVWPASFGTEVVTQEALGFRVHYPANWSASWGRWDDPFAGSKRQAHSFHRVQGEEAPPADANALMFSGEEAPQGLMIFAHRTEHQFLPQLLEGLRSSNQAAPSGGSTSPDYTMNANATWGEAPAREITTRYGGFGGGFYLIVRANGVRYVATCRGMSNDCRSALDQHVELELLNGKAEAVSEEEIAAVRASRPPEDPLVAKLKELLPADGPAGLTRVGFEKGPSGAGVRVFDAVYNGADGTVMISVALFGDEQAASERSKLATKADEQEAVRETQRGGRTVYETSQGDDTTLTLFLGNTGLMTRGGDMGPEPLYDLLDALALDEFEALSAEQ